VATIVEYSSQRKAINAYPAKIVSPPVPSACCEFSSDQVGGVQEESGWRFVYHRCGVCGYTVRRFAPREEFFETVRSWRREAVDPHA